MGTSVLSISCALFFACCICVHEHAERTATTLSKGVVTMGFSRNSVLTKFRFSRKIRSYEISVLTKFGSHKFE